MVIELRYFDDSGCDRCYCWKMPINEAVGLTKWWENKGMQIRRRRLPVVKHKFGSVLISMFTRARVDVQGFGQYGGLKLLGYSLPRKVVEYLGALLQDRNSFFEEKNNGPHKKLFRSVTFRSTA